MKLLQTVVLIEIHLYHLVIVISISACGNGSDTNNEDLSDITQQVDTKNSSGNPQAAISQFDVQGRLIGIWDNCYDHIMTTFSFQANRISYDFVAYEHDDCTGAELNHGVEIEPGVPIWSGDYAITGPTTTASRLQAQNLDISWDTYLGNNLFANPEALKTELHYDIVYTGTDGSILFSPIMISLPLDNTRPTVLDFERQYLKRN